MNDGTITLVEIKSCQRVVEEIVNQIVTIARCYYNGCNVFYGACDTKNVTETIAAPISSLRNRIKQVFTDLMDLDLQQPQENKCEEKEDDIDGKFEHHQANGCVELYEKCKVIQQKNTSNNGDTFHTAIMLLTPETQDTLEKYLENAGTLQCNNVTNGLKYYIKLVNNLGPSTQELIDVVI